MLGVPDEIIAASELPQPKEELKEEPELEGPTPHSDERQVHLDTERSFVLYPERMHFCSLFHKGLD